MNMTSGATLGGWNRRKLNRILAACIAGLSVSAAIAIGTSNVWESDGGNTVPGATTSTFERPTEPIVVGSAEDWGLILEAYTRPRQANSSVDAGEFLGLGQPVDTIQSNQVAPLLDPQDLGSVAAPTGQTQFGTGADAVYAAEALMDYSLPTTFAQDFLGIGQPGEGVLTREQVLLSADETYFGDALAEYAEFGGSPIAASQYAPEAVVDYSLPTTFAQDFRGIGQPGEGAPTTEQVLLSADETYFGDALAEYAEYNSNVVDGHFGTDSASVSAIEGDYLGIGQPSERSTMMDPMIGTLVEDVYVIESDVQLP
jgi:hypothetical protein